MARKALSLYKYLVAGFLALLGFASCSKNKEVLVMYGTPYGNLEIKAKLVDPDGKPLSGTKIRVRLEARGWHDGGTSYNPTGAWFPLDKESDASGNIDTLIKDAFWAPREKETFLIYRVEDNPSHEGRFINDSIRVTPVLTDKKGDWYWGTYRLEGTLKLRKNPKKE